MRILFTALLHVLHLGYSVFLRIQYLWRQCSSLEPQPLQTARRRIPHHIAILFVVDLKSDTETMKTALIESTVRVVRWCRTIGVQKVSVYEENGFLSHCADDIRTALPIKYGDCSESEEEYQPPTPPLSDYADSLPLPADERHNCLLSIDTLLVAAQSSHDHEDWPRNRRTSRSASSSKDDLLVCLLSRSSSKPVIASAAEAIAARRAPRSRKNSRSQKATDFELTVDHLDGILEDKRGLSSPDFMIIHQLSPPSRIAPPELHGFPPWHIRLTEIFQDYTPFDSPMWHTRRSSIPNFSILDESTFRRALDGFASAEMRFGK